MEHGFLAQVQTLHPLLFQVQLQFSLLVLDSKRRYGGVVGAEWFVPVCSPRITRPMLNSVIPPLQCVAKEVVYLGGT